MSNTTEPIILVMMSTLNRPQLALRAVHSVLLQGYKNFHLIVFNDGSSEDYSSLERLVRNNPKVTYIKSHNVGLNCAKNFMLDLFEKEYFDCENAYLTVLDDDDYFSSDAFDTFKKSVEQYPEDDWFCFNVEIISEIKNFSKPYDSFKRITYQQFRADFPGDTHSLHKFSTVSKLRYPQKYFKNGFEHIYYFKIQSPITIIPHIVKYVEYQEDGLSESSLYDHSESLDVLFKHILLDPMQPSYYKNFNRQLFKKMNIKNFVKKVLTEERYYRIKYYFFKKKR